jgi:hypothetical protein
LWHSKHRLTRIGAISRSKSGAAEADTPIKTATTTAIKMEDRGKYMSCSIDPATIETF